jgi:thiamine pyrophosphate-dependent acetolactate synthase large subunit-like protein
VVSGRAGEPLDRRAVVRTLLAGRDDLIVVTGLGSPSYDVMAAGDHDLNFYLWGAMGSAATVGLGLAMAQPRRPVLVITGDGEQLMGLGALATVGVQRPANLTIAVLDNERYGETGMQHSHTADGVRIDEVAAACGFSWTSEVRQSAGVEEARERLTAMEGPGLATFKVAPTDLPRVLPPIDAVYVKHRLRLALGFAPR